MTTYLSLFKFTDEGMRTVKDTTQRVQAVRTEAEAAGGRIAGSWWTLGQYDLATIFEFPDDQSFTRFLLGRESKGYVRGETMRAFSQDEMAHILQGL